MLDADSAGGVDGVAVCGYAGGVGDRWVGDEEESCSAEEGRAEGIGGIVVAVADVEGKVGVG